MILVCLYDIFSALNVFYYIFTLLCVLMYVDVIDFCVFIGVGI